MEAGPSTPRPGTSKSLQITNAVSKRIPYVNELQRREMGFLQPTHFVNTALETIAKNVTIVNSHQFSSSRKTKRRTAYFGRAGQNAMVAAWYLESPIRSSAVCLLYYSINKADSNISTWGCINSPNTILDACQVTTNPDIFMFVSNDRNDHGTLTIAKPRSDDISIIDMETLRHPSHEHYHCCNSNYFAKQFSVGSDGEVHIYYEFGENAEIRQLNENIYSVVHDDKGNLLFMGCQNGNLLMYDLRHSSISCRIQLDQNTLDDIQIVSDNYCLVSGHSGKLMKVDIRSTRKVLDFPSHSRKSQKIPVSFNQYFDLVSCTGADDITRLWSLKNGDLLHSFTAPGIYPARSCLVPDCTSGQIYLIQNDFIHIYGMMR